MKQIDRMTIFGTSRDRISGDIWDAAFEIPIQLPQAKNELFYKVYFSQIIIRDEAYYHPPDDMQFQIEAPSNSTVTSGPVTLAGPYSLTPSIANTLTAYNIQCYLNGDTLKVDFTRNANGDPLVNDNGETLADQNFTFVFPSDGVAKALGFPKAGRYVNPTGSIIPVSAVVSKAIVIETDWPGRKWRLSPAGASINPVTAIIPRPGVGAGQNLVYEDINGTSATYERSHDVLQNFRVRVTDEFGRLLTEMVEDWCFQIAVEIYEDDLSPIAQAAQAQVDHLNNMEDISRLQLLGPDFDLHPSYAARKRRRRLSE